MPRRSQITSYIKLHSPEKKKKTKNQRMRDMGSSMSWIVRQRKLRRLRGVRAVRRNPERSRGISLAIAAGARRRNRTVTPLSGPGILSPVRLPVSPSGQFENKQLTALGLIAAF